ncbi:cupin domain-containing protein [Thermodesulfobacteriota bacterium]
MKPVDLKDHPEGGRFCEVFRSDRIVPIKEGITRSALTHIYFSLGPGEVSRFHRVASDEVWNLYQGTGIILYTWDGTDNSPEKTTLSAENKEFCHVVDANTWQAAEPVSGAVLVGCSVAPGFEYSDFTIMDLNTSAGKRLISIDPDMICFLKG